ncbi:MFS transporter [Dactylosporangium sp. AC04546]|uniref:MFS transporter n=1 Tax=Dactylosporangium sp. AC04546 TaxID=2862460 RepID=UPI001EDDC4E2|nr:MFS transporter [Dactylosporangium sp. AC04546]WVK80901.1 MFS transporter [Dactylosporangium sp. AC04546]
MNQRGLWPLVGRAIALDLNSLLPVGLTGALGVLIVQDLNAPESAGGMLVGAFFVAGAFFILLAASAIDRYGWNAAALAGQATTAVALLACAATPHPWGLLLIGLSLAGMGSSISQPATSVLLTEHVQPRRRGFAMSAKLAAVPAALLLAGIAVPVLGETVGWRASFVIAALFPLSGVVLLLRFRPVPTDSVLGAGRDVGELRRPRHRALWLAGTGMLLGSMLPGVVLAFMVPSMVDVGLTPGEAGLLFAVLNVTSVLSRAAVAVLADSPLFRGNAAIVAMMTLGGLGSALVAVPALGTVLAGAFFAFSMGWGWTGQAFALALRTFTESPGGVASVMQSGGMAGSALGPIVGAAAVYFWGLPAAWILSASASVLGGLAFWSLPSPGTVAHRTREEPA